MHVKLNMLLDICKTLSYWLPRLNMQRQKYPSSIVWTQFHASKMKYENPLKSEMHTGNSKVQTCGGNDNNKLFEP